MSEEQPPVTVDVEEPPPAAPISSEGPYDRADAAGAGVEAAAMDDAEEVVPAEDDDNQDVGEEAALHDTLQYAERAPLTKAGRAAPAPAANMPPELSHRSDTQSSALTNYEAASSAVAGLGAHHTPHRNAHEMTIAEEYARFRQRNGVASGYRGPIYVPEDVQVPCALCGGPLDPIVRVPVGTLFFHPTCVRCCACGGGGLTENFTQVAGTTSAVCSACAAKGRGGGVRQEMVSAARAGARARRPGRSSTVSVKDGPGGAGPSASPSRLYKRPVPTQANPQTALNQAVLPGAAAPSLTIGLVHSARNTSRRSFALMQRQQYYTQSDSNLIMAPSLVKAAAPPRQTLAEQQQQQLSMHRQSNAYTPTDYPRLQ